MRVTQSSRVDGRVLVLSPQDNVGAAVEPLGPGDALVLPGGTVSVPREVPRGHKLALVAIPAGTKVIKYGAPIGTATVDIAPGEHVHSHNLKSDYLPPTGRDRHTAIEEH